MSKISASELAGIIAAKHGISKKEAQDFINTMMAVIKDGVDADRLVKVKGLGTFKVIDVEARESISVRSGERLTIEGHSKLTFLPDKDMKEMVNKPFSMFDTVALNDGVDFNELGSSVVEEEKTAPVIPAPVVPEEAPAPVAPVETPAPVTPVETPAPVAPDETPALVVPDETPALVVPDETPAPVIPDEIPAPVAPVETPAPVVPDVPPAPVAPKETPAPKLAEILPVQDNGEEEEQLSEIEDVPQTDSESVSIEKPKVNTSSHWWILLLAIVVLAAIGVAVWWFLLRKPTSDSVQPALPTMTESAQTIQAADTIPEDNNPVDPIADYNQQFSSDSIEHYNQLDDRVRLGAYNIVGLDTIIAARSGDTPRRIARRMFGGEQMSCYIEAFNGLTGYSIIEEGTEIRIPKIETKQRNK